MVIVIIAVVMVVCVAPPPPCPALAPASPPSRPPSPPPPLPVGRQVDAGDAQVVAGADVSGRESEGVSVRLHRLLTPPPVSQRRPQLVPQQRLLTPRGGHDKHPDASEYRLPNAASQFAGSTRIRKIKKICGV